MAAQTPDSGTVEAGDANMERTDDQATDADAPANVDELSGAPPEEGDEPLELDEVFHILQNERRRQVLLRLRDVEGTVRMRDIAEQIAAWENDTTVDNLYSDQRQRVYIALYQSHLPKLDDLGVIEYNQSRGTIEPTPLVEQVVQYLEPTSDSSGPIEVTVAQSARHWAPAALAGGAVGVLVMTAALSGVFSASLLWTALATVVLGATAMAVTVVGLARGG